MAFVASIEQINLAYRAFSAIDHPEHTVRGVRLGYSAIS